MCCIIIIIYNSNLTDKQTKTWTELGRDLSTATIPSDANEFVVFVYDSSYAVSWHFPNNAPTKTYYSGSNSSGWVGGAIAWNLNTRKLSNPTIVVSGTSSSATMMVSYR